MSADRVIKAARGELGYTEFPPGSNKTKYGEWYGMNGQPWCVMALAYWFHKAGESSAFMGGGKTASCGTMFRWYRERGKAVDEIQPGDIVILNFHGTQATEHCGLVAEVGALGSTRFTTIEGNTSPGMEGSQDNGGCVALKTRYTYQIVGVCRPEYREEDPQPVDDVTGHWAEKDIRWCMERGLMTGYPDGSFQPEKPVTRAELATILDRMAQE